jgi:hypothetical protein
VFESRRGIDKSLVSVVCSQVEISGTGRSIDERYPTEYGVSEYNRGKTEMRTKITKATDP